MRECRECGSCIWWERNKWDDTFEEDVCSNMESDHYNENTRKDDCCRDWEGEI